MKCQNKDKNTNKYCEEKAKAYINGIKVCEICYYWIKKFNKEKNT